MYDDLVMRMKEDKSWVEQGTTQTEHEIAEHIQQAADAIEELSKRVPKSGVWREEDGGYDDVFYECSVCGAGICTVEGDPIDNAWSYCPECGAKMTGIERLPQPPKEE